MVRHDNILPCSLQQRGLAETLFGDSTNLALFLKTQVINHDPPLFIIGFAGGFSHAKDTLTNLADTEECTVSSIFSRPIFPRPDDLLCRSTSSRSSSLRPPVSGCSELLYPEACLCVHRQGSGVELGGFECFAKRRWILGSLQRSSRRYPDSSICLDAISINAPHEWAL